MPEETQAGESRSGILRAEWKKRMTEQAVWTVNKILQWTQQYFSGKGLENPRLDAEVLLCDVLGCRRIDLFMRLQQELQPAELKKYREFVLRRAAWEPLAYIIGRKTFLQWEFKVSPAVLIPRPETELLVEKLVQCCTGKSLTQLEKETFWRKKAEEAKAAAEKVKAVSSEKLRDETDPEKAAVWQQEVADREAVAVQAAERAGMAWQAESAAVQEKSGNKGPDILDTRYPGYGDRQRGDSSFLIKIIAGKPGAGGGYFAGGPGRCERKRGAVGRGRPRLVPAVGYLVPGAGESAV